MFVNWERKRELNENDASIWRVPMYLQDGDQAKQELQRQQLRELLAKQTKHRQQRKKIEEQERILREQGGPGGQLPLRHWPDTQPG